MAEPVFLNLRRRAPRAGSHQLVGHLDDTAVGALRLRLDADVEPARDLLIRCDGVTGIDPAGVAQLWLVLSERHLSSGQRARLVGLNDQLARQLRRHPLATMIVSGEELFRDPFNEGVDSAR